jgi:aerobic C4-dicarboxylate transport protein
VFVVVILGTLLKLVTGINIFKLLKYLAREFLLIISISCSESALPRLIAKMGHLGVSRSPWASWRRPGTRSNLDGTATI